jgi:hypothetical protein
MVRGTGYGVQLAALGGVAYLLHERNMEKRKEVRVTTTSLVPPYSLHTAG